MNKKISFEINAITNQNSRAKVEALINLTDVLNPIYYSVNTEIGTTTWKDTFNTSLLLKNLTKTTIIPHVAINNKDECELNYIAEQYLNAGMDTFFLIRGDKHTISQLAAFNYSIDLIEYYKKNFEGISIISSCYPDFHKETKSLNEEVFWLDQKHQLGVKEFICQFCLNSDAIQNLKNSLNKTITLTPSLFPMKSFSFIERFTKENSIDYPLWIRKTINNSEKPTSEFLSIKIVKAMVNKYLEEFNRLHFFTLNDIHQIERIFFDAD
ncbi:methylenetetrahydrofolate reductase [Serratia sp. 121840015-1]